MSQAPDASFPLPDPTPPPPAVAADAAAGVGPPGQGPLPGDDSVAIEGDRDDVAVDDLAVEEAGDDAGTGDGDGDGVDAEAGEPPAEEQEGDEAEDEVAAEAEEGAAEGELDEPAAEVEPEEAVQAEAEPEEVAEAEEAVEAEEEPEEVAEAGEELEAEEEPEEVAEDGEELAADAVSVEDFEDVTAEVELEEPDEDGAFDTEPVMAEPAAGLDRPFEAGDAVAAELAEDRTGEAVPAAPFEAAGNREPVEGRRPVAEHEPPAPLDLGAWKPIERAGEAEPLEAPDAAAELPTAVAEAAEEAEAEVTEAAEADEADEAAEAEEVEAEEGEEDEVAAEADTDVELEGDDEVEADFEEEDEQLAAEEADGAAAFAIGMAAAEARADGDGDLDAAMAPAEPLEAEPRSSSAPLVAAGAAAVHGAARAVEPVLRAGYRSEAMEPPRTAAEVYHRSSDALERLTGIRPDAAWLENEDIQYGSGRLLESTFAESRAGGGRVDPKALEVALGMAARGERVDDELVAEAATAAVGVLHEALRSLGATSGARGAGDLFEDGATEAFIALHAEEWLSQLGFYDAFPGARADPELSGERLARTYTWQTVAARGYLERFATAAGRLPGSVVDDFVKGGGGATGLNRLHLDYLRTQRREGVEPDVQAEAAAARRMTDDAMRLVAELAGGGLRDPASAGAVAAGIADQVMAGIAVAG